VLEILKAVALEGASLLILDEPTAALSPNEIEKLFALMRRLRDQQETAVVFVTHKLSEVFELCERVVVLKDGQKTVELQTKEANERQLISYMVGRDVGDMYRIRNRIEPGETLLEVDNLSRPDGRVKQCSLQVRRKEVVGIAGLVGAGRTELMRAIFGADRASDGEVRVSGTVGLIRSPLMAIEHKMGMIPEDRKTQGLITNMAIDTNMALALHAATPGLWINQDQVDELVRRETEQLHVKVGSPKEPAASLSGGNQQKIVLAKWLALQPEVLILDEPTRGIDVGAKYEFYRLIDRLAADGTAILLVTSELPEVLALADRILVMNSGYVVAELGHEEASEESIVYHGTRKLADVESSS
jgi:ribose transport system ATP-binding protein